MAAGSGQLQREQGAALGWGCRKNIERKVNPGSGCAGLDAISDGLGEKMFPGNAVRGGIQGAADSASPMEQPSARGCKTCIPNSAMS